MSDNQIIEYVRDMVINNLTRRGYWEDAALINTDDENKELLAHINGLLKLFEKAKEILEKSDKK